MKAAVGVVAAVICGSLLISGVRADAQNGWLSAADPRVAKVVDLPANQSPNLLADGKNRSCIQQDYTTVDQSGRSTTATDCFVDSTLGKMGAFGSPLLFNGTSQAVSVTPDYPYQLQPIPNQGLMLSPRSAPVTGDYLYFYRDIRQAVTAQRNGLGGALSGYTVSREPDFQLKDKSGNPVVASDGATLTYSSNGDWMMFDSPGIGFLRVNLATFDVVPFADSLSRQGDSSNHIAVTAISDDGRYAAVASYEYGYFKVFDLSTCTGDTGNNYSPILNCQSRDYWPYVAAHIDGFKNIYTLRFTNDDNIQATLTYNWQSSSSYSVAKYELTAPGKQAHGLDYLALGDSYISGEGEFQYKTGTDIDTNKCHVSPSSYPFIIGTDLFNQYNSIACSGAEVKDITSLRVKNYNSSPNGAQSHDKASTVFDNEITSNFEPGYRTQLEFVNTYLPKVSTLSIGGNNVGFANVVSTCVKKYVLGHKDCYDSYDERMKLVKLVDGLYPDLQDTYKKILGADPGVQLYVIGYPQVTKAGGSCGLNVNLSEQDLEFAQQFINYLDDTIERAADSVGVRYVDVQHALDGHRLCEASPGDVAVNGVTAGNDKQIAGLTVLGNESFHPNILGHQLLAQAILKATSNMKQAMPTISSAGSAPQASDPIAQAFLSNYPVSNTTFPAVIQVAKDVIGGTLTAGGSTTFQVSGTGHGLGINAPYQVTIVSENGQSTSLGTAISDGNGDLNVPVSLPPGSVLGSATIVITGQNLAGQSLEIDEPAIVIASDDDYDGDGIPNEQEACGLLPGSGQDSDNDGIDDACDPVIGAAPPPNPIQVHLTGNTITISNP